MTKRDSYYQYLDCENEVLRSRQKKIKAGAQALIDAVERYVRQECLRSELLIKKEELKRLIK